VTQGVTSTLSWGLSRGRWGPSQEVGEAPEEQLALIVWPQISPASAGLPLLLWLAVSKASVFWTGYSAGHTCVTWTSSPLRPRVKLVVEAGVQADVQTTPTKSAGELSALPAHVLAGTSPSLRPRVKLDVEAAVEAARPG
jgi:hypothetical protein